MAINMSGLSGIDTQGIIDGLVQAGQEPIVLLQNRAKSLRSAVTSLSELGTSIGRLSSAAAALSNLSKTASYKTTTSGSQITASVNGTPQPGAYSVAVTGLAQEARHYSRVFSSRTDATAVAQSGELVIGAGAESPVSISIDETDNLDAIADKINKAGGRFQASVFEESTGRARLQVRGLDTGAANGLTFSQSGTVDLDLEGDGVGDDGRCFQAADDAAVSIDGYTIRRPTNDIKNAVPGLTLSLKDKTTSPVTVSVAPDADSFQTKVQAVVDAYNYIVRNAHDLGGYGTNKARVKELAGDSGLRRMTQEMQVVATATYGQGTYNSLSSVGISIAKDGTLSLDNDKFDKAYNADANAVQKLFGGSSNVLDGGLMGALRTYADKVTLSTTGTLGTRKATLSDQADKLDERANKEQDRLDAYRDQLKKQFTQMEITYSQNQYLGSQLSKIG